MKTEYIKIRLSERDKDLIRRNSELKSMSMSEYILDLARRDSRYGIRDREAGNVIESNLTYDEAVRTLNMYESQDKEDGTYTDGFYEIYICE